MNNKIPISFVIPVYKSENTIETVVDGINNLRNIDWEVVLINDNSPDDVDKIIKKLILKYPKKISYLQFRKNYGQHSAIIEGLKYSTKKFTATIDDDGQNPPSEVLKMVKCMVENDYDVVYGALMDKKHSCVRNIVSKLNKFMSVITISNKGRIPISNVRLLKRNIVESIVGTPNNYSYIEGMIFSLTDHVGFIYISHEERFNGKSSYNLSRLVKLWFNQIVGYSNFFIKSISIFSFIASFLAFLIGLIYLFLTINNTGRPSGWLSTYLTMTFLFSILFLILGIMSEYVGRIYLKINQNNKRIINNVYIHD